MTSIARPSPRPSQRLNVKTPCQKYGVDSLACKEYELHQLRSTGAAFVPRKAGVAIDPQLGVGGGLYLNVIGDKVEALQKEIEKKSWRRI